MKKIICDICGKEISGRPRYIAFGIRNSAKSPEIFYPYDFCEECTEEIKAMITTLTIPPTTPVTLAADSSESAPAAAGQTDKRPRKRNTPIDMGKVNALRDAGWSVGRIAEEMHIPPEDIAEKIFARRVQEQESTKMR